MNEARDTVTVTSNTTEPNCDGCTLGGNIEGQEGFVNPDCEANKTTRREKGLSNEACGLVLMQYAVDMENHQVFTGRVITTKLTRTLRRIFVEPTGGRWELLEADYAARGNSELIIDLESD
jgi:hypothetical protein